MEGSPQPIRPTEQDPDQPEHHSSDATAIHYGIFAAEASNREIDDGTARRIASQLHGGQASALYSLASSGAIDEERVYREIGAEFEQQRDPEVREWLNWLGSYCLRRGHKGPVEGWYQTPRDEPPEQTIGSVAVAATGPPAHAARAESDTYKPPVEIWVASLTDYNNGRLHGVWIDATQSPDELREAVDHLLRNSYFPNAEEWAIFDYHGFGELKLGEYESLETISRIANGIELYGPAFAAWAAYVGIETEHQLGRFDEHYLGEYDSLEAYVEHVLGETGVRHDLDQALKVIPEDIRRYIDIDTAAIARDWATELHTVETADRQVWVFQA